MITFLTISCVLLLVLWTLDRWRLLNSIGDYMEAGRVGRFVYGSLLQRFEDDRDLHFRAVAELERRLRCTKIMDEPLGSVMQCSFELLRHDHTGGTVLEATARWGKLGRSREGNVAVFDLSEPHKLSRMVPGPSSFSDRTYTDFAEDLDRVKREMLYKLA